MRAAPSDRAPAATALRAERAGLGLKPQHVADILRLKPDIGFFEIHAENYMGAGGPPHAQLRAIGEHYPLSLHGVGLSIGGSGPLDREHLARLKALAARIAPALFSEHLAWSTHAGVYCNDLLPLPYTEESLAIVVAHVDEVQSCLGRPMLLENPSTYVVFAESTLEETEFLREIARRSGCGLLLDVNNVFVSAVNHGFAPEAYVDAFPLGRVGEIHLGGHARTSDETGAALLVDTHDRPVVDPVWALYERVVRRIGPCPTLIEWDADVPPLAALVAEAERANTILRRLAHAGADENRAA